MTEKTTGLPRAACMVEPWGDGFQLVCAKCKATTIVTLPISIDHAHIRIKDFANYHRWCSEPVLEKG